MNLILNPFQIILALKVCIADSNNLIRIGLKTILTHNLKNVEIVEAGSGTVLRKVWEVYAPDVILIDYTAKNFSIDLLAELKQKDANIRFVAITFDQMGSTIVNALKMGVMSYIKKDCDIDEIVDAVRDTAKGNKFFCGQILETIRSESIEVENIGFEPLNCDPISLTERESEIILLIAEGYTNNQIAEKLFLSSHTITTHRKNIMHKLGVNNTAGIVMYAVKANLISANKYLFSGNP